MANLSAGIAANLLMAMVAAGPALSAMPKSSTDAQAQPRRRQAAHDSSAPQAGHTGFGAEAPRGFSA